MTTHWRAADIARIDALPLPEIPVIGAAQAARVLDGIDLWDMWPVCLTDGTTAAFDGRTLWMILSAATDPNPDLRHDVARIRLMSQKDKVWRDHGNLLPDGFAPGTREWAGSAVFDPASALLMLYFTSTGRRGDPFSFEQRMFAVSAPLAVEGDAVSVGDWSPPAQLFTSDGDHYIDTCRTAGGPGLIKGFRDPGFFRDPADGRDYMLFTGSDGRSPHSHNGVIGIAEKVDGAWQLHPPLISGDGINNEFERPHLVHRDGRYYLFWSTQRHVFAPGGPSGPNGLYGMVADNILGPYRPLNGTGLVAANPVAEPFQGYSWLVTKSLDVVSFIDLWGMKGRTRDSHPETLATQFGGTPAPVFTLALNGDETRVVP
ncbi:glycoside hydrolase family 68 protein [Sphingomonas sp. SUN039]|uniref:glycoside hydrolase family 68 protein n=1 Tax=Sphingomonas sp. SUN039 TaxID=2937787 RepID=UPI002164A8D1|nr:glycoside hydrolase family 68 protein [Sphingomonas sp. SUN039]UVO53493.1 glycoside hydrolase family 68 protein [Sphingomonas sp. SUN039]